MIPNGLIGTYTLFRRHGACYVGRSDTNLRRRLLEHCTAARGYYFSYNVHRTPAQAFSMECCLYHALRPLDNVLHPDVPDHASMQCPFCRRNIDSVRLNRLRTKSQ
ncbi:GIY-YIG nuclease family protein [Nocardia brasiliensis]|uniref:GIY-YIG nuclease family protein n=1 Tax=Nocardia brasiliensis TaxID=37326 RepID=UPI001894258A|nr:GIY-YIG nuclease family protein [Nocardia brasiliensis]